MAQNLIEVQDLKVVFQSKHGEVTAVDGVSFAIPKGKTLGVVGESGCGKSVTSMAIMGLIRPHAGKVARGKIWFNGRDLLTLSPKEMRNIRGNEISMIFQDSMTALNPVLTIGTQIIETIRVHTTLTRKQAYAHAVSMLEKVGIPSPERRMKEYPFQLSGGMRQRVMIAMALSGNAQLLIADEPTTALDVTIQAQILDLMNQLKQTTQTSILLITHDMGVVAETADEILVMYAGGVVEHSPTKDIFKNPLHPYTQGLLASIPRLDQDAEGPLYTIEGSVPSPQNMPKGCRFCTRCEQKMEICAQQAPPMFQLGPRRVSCWKYAQEGGEQHA